MPADAFAIYGSFLVLIFVYKVHMTDIKMVPVIRKTKRVNTGLSDEYIGLKIIRDDNKKVENAKKH